MSLIGRKIGRLQVIANSSRKGFVICKCDCGNVHEVRVNNLTRRSKPTVSCGCYRREVVSVTGKNNIHRNSAKRIAINEKYGTNVGVILNQNPNRNNRSGHKGVWYDPVRGTYRAAITLHHQKYCLGTFKHLEDAIKARQEAEERLFAPIIEAVQEEWSTQ